MVRRHLHRTQRAEHRVTFTDFGTVSGMVHGPGHALATPAHPAHRSPSWGRRPLARLAAGRYTAACGAARTSATAGRVPRLPGAAAVLGCVPARPSQPMRRGQRAHRPMPPAAARPASRQDGRRRPRILTRWRAPKSSPPRLPGPPSSGRSPAPAAAGAARRSSASAWPSAARIVASKAHSVPSASKVIARGAGGAGQGSPGPAAGHGSRVPRTRRRPACPPRPLPYATHAAPPHARTVSSRGGA